MRSLDAEVFLHDIKHLKKDESAMKTASSFYASKYSNKFLAKPLE